MVRMKISFIILTYKHKNHLRLCLGHIKNLNLSFPYEIIVVDNASHDGTAEMMKKLYPEIQFIENTKNIGHPAGNNVGIQAASGEYIVMMNADIILQSKKDIEKIIDYIDTHPRVAFVGPKLKNPNGTIQLSCYRKYGKFTPLYRRTFLKHIPFARADIDRHLMKDFDHQETREVEWLLGACLFIRSAALQEIGFMDERLFLYFGDYEWCDRARLHKWQVVYYHDTDSCIHYHKRESDSGKSSLRQLFSPITRIHIKDWFTYKKITKKSHE